MFLVVNVAFLRRNAYKYHNVLTCCLKSQETGKEMVKTGVKILRFGYFFLKPLQQTAEI